MLFLKTRDQSVSLSWDGQQPYNWPIQQNTKSANKHTSKRTKIGGRWRPGLCFQYLLLNFHPNDAVGIKWQSWKDIKMYMSYLFTSKISFVTLSSSLLSLPCKFLKSWSISILWVPSKDHVLSRKQVCQTGLSCTHIFLIWNVFRHEFWQDFFTALLNFTWHL